MSDPAAEHQRRMRLQRKVEEQKRELLSDAELQAAVFVLLRLVRKQGRLKASDRNEILNATMQFGNGDYSPGAKIRQLLRDTLLDQEEKRETPGQS